MNFKDVSGTDMTVNQAFPYASGMTAGKTYTTADNIQVMTTDGGYTTYFLSNGDYGKNSHSVDLENKWVNMGATVASTDTLAPGATFWYLSRGAKAGNNHAITTAGAVDLAESETYALTKEYTLIGCPFPCEVAINGGVEVTGATSGKTYTTADNIQIMTSDGGYATYFFSNGDYGKNSHSADLENKWVKMGETVASEDKFPVGGGAWYLSRSKAGTLKFNNPISK